MAVATGLSGNEIYCLHQKGFTPGNLVVGNSVYSLGLLRSALSGFRTLVGGEITHVTDLIEEGRQTALNRMQQEAIAQNADGITGVTSELILHNGLVEFLSIGSVIFNNQGKNKTPFSTSAEGQDLYAQLDAGFTPISFAFGNVAYSLGVANSIVGALKTIRRGEITEYSEMFNQTRHVALTRIGNDAIKLGANVVCGIKTTILPFLGAREMLMIGTAATHPQLKTLIGNNVITSDLTNIEMWNLAKLGFAPMQLLLGTSVYSLGIVGGISAILKSFVRGEINELTKMIYDARENALDILNRQAKAIGADDIVGIKTYVYQLGNGVVEFLAIGTAVKKLSSLKTESEQLPPQAIVVDENTFYSLASSTEQSTGKFASKNPVVGLFFIILVAVIIWKVLSGGQ